MCLSALNILLILCFFKFGLNFLFCFLLIITSKYRIYNWDKTKDILCKACTILYLKFFISHCLSFAAMREDHGLLKRGR